MLIDKVKATVKKFRLLEKKDRVIVAVSGGPDSTALLFALNGLKHDYDIRLHVAHFDHMFRAAEETMKDYEYVSALCEQLKIPLIFKRVDVPAYAKETGLSLEEAAREKRYEFLHKSAKEVGAKKIALGHTLDDQAETVLMRLIRGSGLGGLRGIPPMRPLDGAFIIRPLIETWRKEVEGYLADMKVNARQDATNLMPKFLRNRIRHELMILLKEYNPNIKEVLVRIAQNFSYDYEVLSDVVEKAFKKCGRIKDGSVKINLQHFRGKQQGIRRGILRRAIETAKGTLRGIDYSHIEEIEGLIETGRGAIELPGKIRVVMSNNSLVFSRTKTEAVAPKIWREISVPGSAFIPELGITFEAKFVKSSVKSDKPKTAEYMDYDEIKSPLYVRRWEKGDRFRPLGMSKAKKLQDFFVDQKIPRNKRSAVPLLVSGKDIIWVCGLRLSDDVKITGSTKRILKISYKKA